MTERIRLIVAMHKPYALPDDPMYVPLHVGAKGKPDFYRLETIVQRGGIPTGEIIPGDDTGDNISEKNPSYCELTGLYWAWKNLDADAVGLVHYRRHFTAKSRAFRKAYPWESCCLKEAEAKEAFCRGDIVVPARRNYVIENLYSHYAHTLDALQLDLAEEIVFEKTPEYTDFVRDVYARSWGYMFNMMILKKEDLNDYCSWIFPVLFELEKRIAEEKKEYSSFEARLYGRVSEILFNAWVEKKRSEGARIVEMPYLHTEPVNWAKKGSAFLAAKFLGKKYTESF